MDQDEKIEVIRKRADKVTYLLECYKSDVRDFDYILNKLLDMLEEVEEQTIQRYEADAMATPEDVKRIVQIHFNCDVNAFTARSNKTEFVTPRQIAMYMCTVHCNRVKYPLKKIGAAFGGRDHSTVLYACDRVEDLMFSEKKYKTTILDINDKILLECPKNNVN